MNDSKLLDAYLGKAITASIEKSKPTPSNEAAEFEADSRALVKEQIEDLKHYRGLRSEYAGKVFYFMCIWSGLVIAILITRGFLHDIFELGDAVLITLAGGTTVSVVGLVGFIVQGLFNSGSHHHKTKDR